MILTLYARAPIRFFQTTRRGRRPLPLPLSGLDLRARVSAASSPKSHPNPQPHLHCCRGSSRVWQRNSSWRQRLAQAEAGIWIRIWKWRQRLILIVRSPLPHRIPTRGSRTAVTTATASGARPRPPTRVTRAALIVREVQPRAAAKTTTQSQQPWGIARFAPPRHLLQQLCLPPPHPDSPPSLWRAFPMKSAVNNIACGLCSTTIASSISSPAVCNVVECKQIPEV